jgi:nucleotidyltransferase substrate binding protein (TIGR01987 family)
LCWKTLKKFLWWFEGVEANTPKEILRKAYAAQWIGDETLWLKMLEDRNLTSHTYQEKLANEVYQRIKLYYPELKKVYDFLRQKIESGPAS